MYEAPFVWGPWTLAQTQNWATQGYYNGVPVLPTVLSGTTFTYLTTGDFITDYNPYAGTATIQHQ